MSYWRREEKAIERILRVLMKLPENRRCINCDHLGPRYVCTSFSTFVCTVCSGVHREFGHRVKSVSMAHFNHEEVLALQDGGNERAREIYLEAWDPVRNTQPDGSDIDKIRDFIKHVYVDKIFTGEWRPNMPAVEKSGDKDNFYERYSIEKSGLRREDLYERRYHERSRSSRSERNHREYTDDRNNRKHIDEEDYRNHFEGSSPRSIYERFGSHRKRSSARFEIVDNRIRDDRYERRRSESLKKSSTDTSMSVEPQSRDDRYGRQRSESLKISSTDTSMSLEPQSREDRYGRRRSESLKISSADTSMSPEPQRREGKADPMALEPQIIRKKLNPPVLRPLRDIMLEMNPTAKAGTTTKANKAKDANGAAYHQKTASSESRDSSDVKEASESGLIDSKNNLDSHDTSAKTQTESGSSIPSSTEQKTSNLPSINSVEFLLLELSVAPVGNASENQDTDTASLAAPNTSSTTPVASLPEPVASSNVPTASPTAHIASPTAPVTSSAVAPTTESAATPKMSATRFAESPAASSSAVASSNVSTASPTAHAASPTAPVTSSAVAATTESASTTKTSATCFAESPAPSSEGTAQTHPFGSADSASRVAEEERVKTTQHHQPSASLAERNSSTGPQDMTTFEAFFDQPWPSSPAPTVQEAPGNASTDQSSQAVSKEAQNTKSPEKGSKSSGRKELPAELFTFSYPMYPAPIHNWQFRPPHGMGYGMQYAPSPNVAAFPSSAKSRNPFDVEDDSRTVEGAMLPSIASVPGALSQMPPHAGMQPQPLPFASGMPPEPPYGMYMPTGGYMGQQLPNNTPSQRPQGTGSFGGGSAFASFNPTQQYPGGYSSNPALGASNSFPSAGGNPFA